MALFQTIAVSGDLPSIGAGRESGSFDFKRQVDAANQRELAKDVAAFANSLGGVILVGAQENIKTGSLAKYFPMDLATAQSVKEGYELAAVQRCDPPPLVDVVRIETVSPLSPGHVVAVNVYPTPMGPVGVRWDTAESFAFALRLATHTRFMRPVELAMVMVPEIRRVAILLDSIPLTEREDVALYSYAGGGSRYESVTFLGIDDRLTTARFVLSRHLNTPGSNSAIPLDRIKSAWRLDDNRWAIAAEGVIEVRGHRFLFFPK